MKGKLLKIKIIVSSICICGIAFFIFTGYVVYKVYLSPKEVQKSQVIKPESTKKSLRNLKDEQITKDFISSMISYKANPRSKQDKKLLNKTISPKTEIINPKLIPTKNKIGRAHV